ncbi:MAG: chitobiase/beta-hexosaminidase C-terminal domain-containing protein [Bacteroidales bacterium]|nr:chitobiase/beta-hexosaminidase C-terminal domain-containing protein [Bacteroidales bacterium]
MKKISAYFGIIAAAALTLVSCAKEINTPVVVEDPIQEGIPFEIVVNPQTKTTIDGLQTKWAAGDKINLYHAVAGSAAYVNDSEFTTESTDASATFTGTLASALESGTYDWYAMYPYTAAKEDPSSLTKGYMTMGSAKSGSQKQTGNNSTAHLAGSNYPLSGKAAGVAYDETPSVTLQHLCSFVEVNVTNNSGSPLIVTEITLTAPENIIGTFYINITDPSNIEYVKSSDSYVTATATLNVLSGESIADGASAKFYLGLKPFTLAQGSHITVSVNGYDKDITATAKAYSFQAGKVKTVNFDYDYVSGISEPTAKTGFYRVEDVSWLKAGDRVVIATDAKAMSATQGSNNRPAVDISTAAEGDYTVLTSNASVQEFILETGTKEGSFGFWIDNGSDPNKYIYAASSSSNHMKSQDNLDANASFTVTVGAGGEAAVIANGSNTHKSVRYNSSSNIFSCYASGQDAVSIYKYYGGTTPTCVTPEISVSGATVTITSTPGATIYYTIDGGVPSTSSTEYTAPFDLASAATVKAIAVRKHYNDSAVGSKECELKCAAPVITRGGASFEISCDTPGATIYYETSTVDMASVATPTASSSVYTSAVAFAATTYVKAIAVKDGFADSDVVSETCTYSAITKYTSTLTFTAKCNGSGTADDGAVWTVASDGAESTYDSTKGIHYGTNSAQVKYITLTTDDIPGTITRVVVNASTASGVSATASVTVGGSAFGGDAQSLSSTAADYTFDGSASGEIVVTVTKPSKATKAIYVKSVTVTYEN